MTQPQHLPDVVAHADWGSDPKKRWMARAVRQGDRYMALPAEPVGPPETLISRLHQPANHIGSVFLGFDFPIGIPIAYANQVGIEDFLSLLPLLGQGDWVQFFELAQQPHQVSASRPFYPFRPGGTKQQHLISGLGVRTIRDLLRVCERRTDTRGDACALFWTLGGNQVGRAAIIGWRDVLAPAIRSSEVPISLWPFHGSLSSLLTAGRIVVAETYPTEFYHHLGITFPASRSGSKSGKRVQRDRQAATPALMSCATRLDIALHPMLATQLQQGFGTSQDGEDPFDAVVGLFGMLNVLMGGRPSSEPTSTLVQRVEGWILGQLAI